MRLSFTPLSLAAWFALGATTVMAAPSPNSGGGPKPQAQCPVPDAAECVKKDYLDSACGKKHVAVCQPFVKDALTAYHSSAAPKIRMLRPRLAEMPKHVVLGKYFSYKKIPEMTKKGAPMMAQKVYKKAGDVLAGIAGMDMSATPPVDRVTKVDPKEAVKFWREPTWKSNGYAIRSCEEYAYSRSFNAARFIDAASACRGDRECVFSVAYMPGPTQIAKPKLQDESGELMTRQLTLPTGGFPKNDMFVEGMDKFIEVPSHTLPNGMVIELAEVAGLKSALKSGARFYNIGVCTGASCNNKSSFKDVWDWHKYLHKQTLTLSQNEAEEYERRRAKFRALLEQWNAAVAWEKSLGKDMVLEQELVLPFDMRAYDPFERYTHEREYIERGRATRELLKQQFGAQVLDQPRAVAIPQMRQKKGMQGAFQRSGAAAAAGLFAMPAPSQNKPTPTPKADPKYERTSGPGSVSALEHSQAYASDDAEISKCLSVSWGFEANYKGPISCRIQEFLIGEWRRKAAGQKSCLDLGNPECDWTLEMFEAGILAQVQKLDVLVADKAFCSSYVEPGDYAAADANANNGQWTLIALTKIFEATKARIEKELKAVSAYRLTKTNKGQPLGKDWVGGDYVGDKKWFAAGYDYSVGWEVAPTEKNDSGQVCRIEGSIHGDASFDAWIASKPISVVEGNVRVEARSSGSARANASLFMMGEELFNTHGWASAQTFGPDSDGNYGVQVPGGVKPRFDFFVGVPISGQLWGELLFGSVLEMHGTVSGACPEKVTNPEFGVHARYMPFFGAFGIGQVGVGIAGIASAGIRASLNLIVMGLPIDVNMQAGMTTEGKKSFPTVSFASQLSLMLSTMSGRVSLYVEFLMFDEEFELFRWKGFSTEVPLMPKISTTVSFTGLK